MCPFFFFVAAGLGICHGSNQEGKNELWAHYLHRPLRQISCPKHPGNNHHGENVVIWFNTYSLRRYAPLRSNIHWQEMSSVYSLPNHRNKMLRHVQNVSYWVYHTIRVSRLHHIDLTSMEGMCPWKRITCKTSVYLQCTWPEPLSGVMCHIFLAVLRSWHIVNFSEQGLNCTAFSIH